MRKNKPKRNYANAGKKIYEAAKQMRLKHGPIYEKWKMRWEAATGRKL